MLGIKGITHAPNCTATRSSSAETFTHVYAYTNSHIHIHTHIAPFTVAVSILIISVHPCVPKPWSHLDSIRCTGLQTKVDAIRAPLQGYSRYYQAIASKMLFTGWRARACIDTRGSSLSSLIRPCRKRVWQTVKHKILYNLVFHDELLAIIVTQLSW